MWDNLENKDNQAPDVDNPENAWDETLKRYKEQAKWSADEAKRLRTQAVESEAKLATLDANNILALYQKDPKLANDVAKHLGYESYDEALPVIEKQTKVPKKANDGNDEKSKFMQWYQEAEADKEHIAALNSAKAILNEDEDATKYFNELVGNRKVTKSQAQQFANMATLYVKQWELKQDILSQGLANLAGTWLTQNAKTQKESKDQQNAEFAKNFMGGKFANLYEDKK